MSFMYLNRFRVRDLVNAIAGIALPFFVVLGLLYFFNSDYEIFQGYELNRNIFQWFTELELLDILPLVIYVFLLILMIFSFPALTGKTNLQVQKKINIFYWFLLASFFCIFLINSKNPQNLLILSLPSAIILGMITERTKAPALEEFFHLVILGGILFLHFNSSINILS